MYHLESINEIIPPQDGEYSLYYVGLILALVSCFCGGVMNVVVSKYEKVP